MTKVGIPGADAGALAAKTSHDRGAVLKHQGYATGQFGKNHLGDRNEFLPTVHGFDEFFGNLYHLNAEEEPELPTIRQPRTSRSSGRTSVLAASFAATRPTRRTKTTDPVFGKVGQQTIEDTGPLTNKRMETCDDEFAAAANDFIKRQHKAEKPFFCWLNTTHMHFRTHPEAGERRAGGALAVAVPRHHDRPRQARGRTAGPARQARHRRKHDRHVQHRQRAAHEHVAGRRHDAVPQREEHQLGGCLPSPDDGALARQDPGGRGLQRDRATQRLAPDVPRGRRRAAHQREALEGLRCEPQALQGPHRRIQPAPVPDRQGEGESRKGFLYFNDDGDLVALRFDNWKIVFMEQRVPGTLAVWAEPFVALRVPKIYNLRTDPFERADITSNTYYDWLLDHAYMVAAAQSLVSEFVATLREFPPRQKPASFTIDQALTKMSETAGGAGLTSTSVSSLPRLEPSHLHR